MAGNAGKIDEIITKEAIAGIQLATDKLEKLALDMSKFKPIPGMSGGGNGSARDYDADAKAAKALTDQLARYQAQLALVGTEQERELTQLKEDIKIKKAKADADKSAATSIAGMTANLKLLNAEYNKLSREERNSAKGKELQTHMKNLNTETRNLQVSLSNMKANVGNYPGAMKAFGDSIRSSSSQMGIFGGLTNSVGKGIGNLQGTFNSLKGGLVGLVTMWTAAAAALGGVISFFKKAVEGAMEDERAERKLSLALDENTAAAQRLLRFKEKLMNTTLLGEDEIMKLINYSLAMGRSEVETKKLVEASIMLSNASGGQLDVMSAMDQLNKTYAGDLGRLKKYTGELTKVQLENGDAIDIVRQRYVRFLSEGLGTTEGELIQTKKWFGEWMDDIGAYLMETARKMVFSFKLITGTVGPSDAERAKARQDAKQARLDDLAALKEGLTAAQKRTIYANELKKALALQEQQIKDNAAALEEANKQWAEYVKYMNQVADLAEHPEKFIGPIHPDRPYTAGAQVSTGVTISAPQKVPNVPFENISEVMTPEQANAAEMAKWNQRLQIASEFTAKLTELGNVYYQNELSHLDEEVQATSDAKDKELAAAQGNKSKEDAINKKYAKIEKDQAKEKKKILHDQAVMAKAMSLVNAIVNTAAGVAAQLTGGPGTGIALAVIAAALGAIEIATILATNVPAYAKGRQGGRAEVARVSEQGQEGLITKSGSLYPLPQSESLAYLPEGSSVIPHDEFMKAAMRATMPDYITTSTQNNRTEMDQLQGFMMLANVIKNKKELGLTVDENGFKAWIKNGFTYEEYLNKYVRF